MSETISDEELSLKIAEHLEPKQMHRPGHSCGMTGYNPMLGDTCDGCDARGKEYPELKFWIYRKYSLQPRNFVTDPAMTVMLIQKLFQCPFDTRIKTGCTGIDLHVFRTDLNWTTPAMNQNAENCVFWEDDIWPENIGYAVAEAFARAEGLL